MSIWTKTFWMGAGERAIATFWQTFLSVAMVTAGGAAIPSVGIEGVPWLTVLSVSGLATILSLAKSLGNVEFTSGQAKTTSQNGSEA